MRNVKGQFEKKFSINKNFFIEKKENFYYLLGLMASDGNVKNSRTFSLTQSGENGKKLIDFISYIIGSDYPIYHNKKYNYHCLTITDSDVVKILNEYNILPNKTLKYVIPNKINKTYFNYFLQGYIDGDGSVGVYDNGKGVKTLTISLVGTEEFITEVNKRIDVKGNIRKIKKCKNLFELRFYGVKAMDFFYEIYNKKIYESYKYLKIKNFVNNDTLGIKYKKYYYIKNEVINEIKFGIKPSELSIKYNVPLKTIYSWKYRNI